jgi:YvrJ-like protein
VSVETIDAIIRFVQGVGFPAVVAIFVLWRLDAAMRALVKEIHELSVFLRSK